MIIPRLTGKNSGQILVETVVALSMVVVGLLGLMSLLSNSIGLSRVISNQYTGSYLAGEGIELVKDIFDNNVYKGAPPNQDLYNCGGGCDIQWTGEKIEINPGTSNLTPEGLATVFQRQVSFKADGTDRYKVNSTVTWRSRGSDYQVVVEDYIYDWRE